jgi:hypothetical protein
VPDGLAAVADADGFPAVLDGDGFAAVLDGDGFAGVLDGDGFAAVLDGDGFAALGEALALVLGDGRAEPVGAPDGVPDAAVPATVLEEGEATTEGDTDTLGVGVLDACGGGGAHARFGAPRTAPSEVRLKTGLGAANMPRALARAASACGAA